MSIHLKCPSNLLQITRHPADFLTVKKTDQSPVQWMSLQQIRQSADYIAFSMLISLSLSYFPKPRLTATLPCKRSITCRYEQLPQRGRLLN